VYCADYAGELSCEDRSRQYGDHVSLHQVVVNVDDSWQGATGFVTDLLNDTLLSEAAATDAYLCGPPPMIDAAREKLAALGVPAARIFAEKFLPSDH